MDGIDPAFFNPNSRFGGGFYLAKEADTAVAEVAAHGTEAKYLIRFNVNLSGQNVLDLSDVNVAKQWGFDINSSIQTHQQIAAAARLNGYVAIIAPSLRGSGENIIVYDKFDEILSPQMVVPVP